MLALVAMIGLVIVVGGIGIVLGLSEPPEERVPLGAAAEPLAKPAERPSTFFVAQPRSEEQMEILLARLEQHVRQERAAVEMFPDDPSAATLRRNTSSPLAN